MRIGLLPSCSALAGLVLLMPAGGTAASVAFEAESGALGADFTNATQNGVQFISIATDLVNTNFPGNTNRVATYTITFPEAGTYNLFARIRTGPDAPSDDSMFYGSGFGTKSPTNGDDWILINNLSLPSGFTNQNEIVAGSGNAGNQVWKWLNLSQFTNSISEAPVTFTVPSSNLVQTFQMGARENGFDIDKFVFGSSSYTFTVADLDAGASGTPPPPPKPADRVSGNLVQFSDNGAWCWYQDERAVVDPSARRMIVGCVENGAGMGGPPHDGNVDAIFLDLQTRFIQKFTLTNGFTSYGGGDDHNAPAFLVRPDGKYLALYAGHNNDNFTFYNIFDPASGVWGPQQAFDWGAQPGGDDFPTTYSNPHYLSAENRTYNLARGNGHGSQNIMVSSNYGDTWTYGGELTTNGNVGYVNGYFKYCDNGIDRIDFICTEYHPRDFNTSIYHGYISNGMSFKTDGTLVDPNIFDKESIPTPQSFTPVFAAGTVLPPGQTNYRCWDDDICRYADGTIECIISSRINDNTQDDDSAINPNHAFFFCRYDGSSWSSTYLCQAGYKTHATEADYVGLGCLCPDDPNTIFISTRFDPRAVKPGVFDTNAPYSGAREIWKGVTTNHGASFSWTPITQDSSRDNLRPIVPSWNANSTALLWYRGTYNSAQTIDAAVVGIVDCHAEVVGPMTYVDATASNTFFAASGIPLVTGTSPGQWHERTGVGNGGSLLASADVISEDAPALRTSLMLPGPGTYDVWANFWGCPESGSDWRIEAGLATNAMRLFRQMASREVRSGDHNSSLVLTNLGMPTNFLYQAYLGRMTLSSTNALNVYVDDDSFVAGSTNTSAPDSCRTWYDGVSYARVDPFQIQQVSRSGLSAITLVWNSPPPGPTLTSPTYTVQKKHSLAEPAWSTVASDIPSGGFSTTTIDNNATDDAAFYRVVWP